MNNIINKYLSRIIIISAFICLILVYFFPDYFYGIIAFQVVVFIIALVNAYYLKSNMKKSKKAYNERFGDLADRMNKLFGEDWSNLK